MLEYKIIVAIDKDNLISCSSHLYTPKQLEYFRELTFNNNLIMGRIAWETLNKKITRKRANCVLTSCIDVFNRRTHEIYGPFFFKNMLSLDCFLNSRKLCQNFIIGGVSVYNTLVGEDFVKEIICIETDKGKEKLKIDKNIWKLKEVNDTIYRYTKI